MFSGRRGAHCWISDYSAKIMSPSERRALVSYLNLPRLAQEKRTPLTSPLHPSIEYSVFSSALSHAWFRRSAKIVEDSFASILLEDDGIFCNPDIRSHLLKLLPENSQLEFQKILEHQTMSSNELWARFERDIVTSKVWSPQLLCVLQYL